MLALHTAGKNEVLDFYLTQWERPASVLGNYEVLQAYFARPERPLPSADHTYKGNFEKLKMIGSGGFSKVYRGKSERGPDVVRKKDTGELYAMKVIKKAAGEFYSEIKIMHKLEDHPFFTKLLWTFETVSPALRSLVYIGNQAVSHHGTVSGW